MSSAQPIFSQKGVSITFVMKRWGKSRDTVLRLLEEGKIRGYRLHERGWWTILMQSVLDYEQQLAADAMPDPAPPRQPKSRASY